MRTKTFLSTVFFLYYCFGTKSSSFMQSIRMPLIVLQRISVTIATAVSSFLVVAFDSLLSAIEPTIISAVRKAISIKDVINKMDFKAEPPILAPNAEQENMAPIKNKNRNKPAKQIEMIIKILLASFICITSKIIGILYTRIIRKPRNLRKFFVKYKYERKSR